MTTSTIASSTRPSSVIDVRNILEDANRGPSVILTRKGCVRVEPAGSDTGPAAFMDALVAARRTVDERPADASAGIFGESSAADLGHAPSWVDGGALCETLLTHIEVHGAVPYVFCLDLWAAMLRSQAPEELAAASWVFVSDLADRKAGPHQEYWEDMEEWYGELPFFAIIPLELWSRSIAWDAAPRKRLETARVSRGAFRQKPGAWRWMRISASDEGTCSLEGMLLYLVRCSGSLPNVKVFLESVARQHHPKDRLAVVLVLSDETPDLREYLRWFRIVNPELAVDSLILSPRPDVRALRPVLGRLAEATVIVLDDHSVLSEQFCTDVLQESASTGVVGLQAVPLSVEASAQIITGNLDPLPHYGEMLRAFRRGNPPGTENRSGGSGVVVRPYAWRQEAESIDAVFAQLGQVAERLSGMPAPAGGVTFLRLADFP